MRIKKQFVIVFFILICCLFATLWSSAAETADAEEANEIIAAARKADSLYRSIIVNDTQWLCFGNLFSEKSQEKYTGMYGWIFASPQNKVYLPELTEEKSDDDYFYIQTNFTDKNELYKVIDELFYQLEGIYDEENFCTKPVSLIGYKTPEIYEYEGRVYLRSGPCPTVLPYFDIENAEVELYGSAKARLTFDIYSMDPESYPLQTTDNEIMQQNAVIDLIKDDGKWKIISGSDMYYSSEYLKVPDTGENTDIIIFSVIAAIALLGMGTVILKGKRTKAAD